VSEQRTVVQTLGTVRGGLTATASAIAAVLGVVFLLIPSWRPLSRDKIEASVAIAAIERNVTLREWSQRQFPGDPRGELRRLFGRDLVKGDDTARGNIAYVRLHADGFKRRSIKLRARIYDAHSRRPPRNTDFDVVYPSSGKLDIDAPSRASVQLIMLDPFTQVPGCYFIRVEAYDKGGILAYDDSGPIEGDFSPDAC
jgi:hypothetical protein